MPFPVSLAIAGRLVVIIGGGTIASRKARSFLDAGARVHVIAPEIHEELRAIQTGNERFSFAVKTYERADLQDAFLIVVATNDEAVNAQAVDDARGAKILVLDATNAERSDLVLLATGTIGEMAIAVDSGKSTPAFAKRVVKDAQALLGTSYGKAAQVLAHARTYARATLSREQRMAVLRNLSELPIDELAGMNPVEMEHRLESMLEERHTAPPRTVICATRASRLALTQTRTVASQLAQRGIATTLLQITTTGDKISDKPIHAIGAENIFVKELETALREKKADYAVHSCKDLPSDLAPGMRIAAISVREDPRDAFCSERYATFALLPPGARVGTSSPRRQAQLRALRNDLQYGEMRGNVDTRLRKLAEGQYDAIVLAMAGLRRLDIRSTHVVPFAIDEIVPAAAQGALAVETREEDEELAAELRAAINDPQTELCIIAERAALRTLHGGCRAPIGIHAYWNEQRLNVTGAIGSVDGISRADVSGSAEDARTAELLGIQLAQALLNGMSRTEATTIC